MHRPEWRTKNVDGRFLLKSEGVLYVFCGLGGMDSKQKKVLFEKMFVTVSNIIQIYEICTRYVYKSNKELMLIK